MLKPGYNVDLKCSVPWNEKFIDSGRIVSITHPDSEMPIVTLMCENNIFINAVKPDITRVCDSNGQFLLFW